MSQFNIREILGKNKIVPVVTIESLDKIDSIAKTILNQKITCIEVTLRTPVALEAIAILKKEYGKNLDVGVGTLVSADQLKKVADLGVDFIVSPGLMEHLAQDLQAYKIAFIPGVVTPSEIIRGMALGYDTFKFFPAELVGGLPMIKAYEALFPHVLFCPTGGINVKNYESYLAQSNVISVGGSWVMST
jgi:2-dehydro-3-deoxyphosphogluconate aldolase/(4S)-4-hydroxy-2-oxoglutarate aldolase